MYLLVWLFAATFFFGLALGFTFGIILTIQPAAAQTNTTSSPELRFLPQEAYIQTVPPVPVQNTVGNGSLTDMLIPIVASIAGIVVAKIHGDKKIANVADVTRSNVSEIMKGKVVDKELARVSFKMNPVEAEKITDAPDVKLQTLSADVTDYADKTAKTKLP